MAGEIKVELLRARYRDDTPIVLHDLSFTILPGSHVTVCGRTGSGKSTLLLCLLNLIKYDGKITVGGYNIHYLDPRNYRSSVGVIPQEPLVHDGTLRYNIDPRNKFKDDEIINVLKEVGMEILLLHPDKLNQIIKDDQMCKLSIGQQQLLTICRLILNKFSIIIMDEALASIDKETSDLIEDLLTKHFKQCTLIRVSHHISDSINSNKVLVLDDGKIVEYENPKLLLQNKESFFSKLYNN